MTIGLSTTAQGAPTTPTRSASDEKLETTEAYAKQHHIEAADFADEGMQEGVAVEKFADTHDAVGSSFNPDTGTYFIALPASTNLSNINTSFVAAPVTLKTTTKTKEQITTTRHRIDEIVDAHPGYTYAYEWNAEIAATSMITDAPAEVISAFKAVEPDISVEYGKEDNSDPVMTQVDRGHDISPFYGGAAIVEDGSTERCTSGANMISNASGQSFAVTAGHCFDQGNFIFAGVGGAFFGAVIDRATFPLYDMEAIRTNCCGYSPRIWYAFQNTISVHSASGPSLGYHGTTGICASGAVSVTERCGGEVRSTSAVFAPAGGGRTTDVMTYSRDSGSQMTTGGDSGAPVYFHRSGGGAHVVGLHIGRIVTNGRSLHYAEKYTTLSARFNAHISTI